MVFISIIALLLSPIVRAELPTLQTKQEVRNLRFITKDGKISIYKKYSGPLELSTNYSAQVIIDAPKGTDYRVKKHKTSNQYLIEVLKKQFYNHQLIKNNSIFHYDADTKALIPLASSVNPQFSAKTSWISSYDVKKKKILFYNLKSKKSFHIESQNTKKPYFIPQVEFYNQEYIIISDMNSRSEHEILLFSRIEKSFKKIVKDTRLGSKLEFCVSDDSLVVGEFSYPSIDNSSYIYQIPLSGNKDFKKKNVLYESKLRDLGSIICDNNDLYFVKTFSKETNLDYYETDIAKLSLKTKKIKRLSNLKRLSHLFTMDNRILSPFRKSIYVVKGKSSALDDSIKREKN